MTNAIIEAQGGTVERFDDEVINIDEEMNKTEEAKEEKRPNNKKPNGPKKPFNKKPAPKATEAKPAE
jgi:hypothetical protein